MTDQPPRDQASTGQPGAGPARVLVTGASGNVGTALLRRLQRAPGVTELRAVCRRPPEAGVEPYDAVTWHALDLSRGDVVRPLTEAMRGADAVVHLAWQIQPSHDQEQMRRTNVDGTARVAEAAAAAGVPHLVHISSVGAYAPGPKDRAVEEDWPVTGVRSSAYSRHKADAEGVLDAVQSEYPQLAVARVRPGIVLQRDAGSEIARYFLGGLLPKSWMGRLPLPLLPLPAGMQGQVVHADDLAEAIWAVLQRRATGPFNVATDPPVTAKDVARAMRAARYLPVPWALVRAVAALTWRIHLQPTSEGWVDLAREVPLMSTARARRELGWRPRVSGPDALSELVRAMGEGAGTPSPPMEPRSP